MRIELVGEAPARALLLPGSDLAAPFYRPLARALLGLGVPTALATLPGFAGVPPLPSPSWAALIEAVLSLMPRPPVLIGHSMGGLLALLAAARDPAAFTHLVLLEPAIFPNRLIAGYAARRYLADVVRGDRESFVNDNGATRRVRDPSHYPPEMIAHYLEVRRTSHRPTAEVLFETMSSLYPLPFERLEPARLLVTGEHTGWLMRAMQKGLHERLRAEHYVLPGAAHWLVNERDQPLAERIARFVGPLGKPSGAD